jgi:hypothetical protein
VEASEQQPGVVAAAAWAQLSALTQLTALDVNRCGSIRMFDAEFLIPIVAGCGSCLQSLQLDSAAKAPGQLAELLPACLGLTSLDLSYSRCSFSSADLEALAGLTNLVQLLLRRCYPMLRDAVVPVLMRLEKLELLDLHENDLSVPGMRALLSGLPQLTELRIGWNFDVSGPAMLQVVDDFPHIKIDNPFYR